MAEITPVDIQNKVFRRALRGYSPTQVDAFLDEVTRTLDSLLRENEALKQQTSELSEKVERYRGIEETLQQTLVLAQETADEVRTNARKEVQLMLAEARTEADRIREEADEELRQTREHAQRIRSDVLEYLGKALAATTAQTEILRSAQSELYGSPGEENDGAPTEEPSGDGEPTEGEWN